MMLPPRASEPGASAPTGSRVAFSEILAEAAVWVARLHGPARSKALEQEFLEWQARSDEHRTAFERCTETWQSVSGLTMADAYAAFRATQLQASEDDSHRSGSTWCAARRGLQHYVVVAAVLILAGAAIVVWQPWRNVDEYSTGVGEQRVVVLYDGTRMSLNTSTHLISDQPQLHE